MTPWVPAYLYQGTGENSAILRGRPPSGVEGDAVVVYVVQRSRLAVSTRQDQAEPPARFGLPVSPITNTIHESPNSKVMASATAEAPSPIDCAAHPTITGPSRLPTPAAMLKPAMNGPLTAPARRRVRSRLLHRCEDCVDQFFERAGDDGQRFINAGQAKELHAGLRIGDRHECQTR